MLTPNTGIYVGRDFQVFEIRLCIHVMHAVGLSVAAVDLKRMITQEYGSEKNNGIFDNDIQKKSDKPQPARLNTTIWTQITILIFYNDVDFHCDILAKWIQFSFIQYQMFKFSSHEFELMNATATFSRGNKNIFWFALPSNLQWFDFRPYESIL